MSRESKADAHAPSADSLAAPGDAPGAREYAFTDADFGFVREHVMEHAGISLADSKREMVYGRLARRVRALGLQSFSEYCRRIERDPGESIHLINAITTNLTGFFRENHHFEFLRTTVVPEILERNRASRRIRIWSAGCSTGEEPYSIAIALQEALADVAGWDVKILATDIDTNVLERARHGVYSLESVKQVSAERRRRWFRCGAGANRGQVKVGAALQDMIAFHPLNLMEAWPMKGPFDAVFCRNVVIYFDKPTQKQLFRRFADMLGEGRYLFVGHSESLFQVCDRFELLGQTIYKKRREA